MLDFVTVTQRITKKGTIESMPSFRVVKSKDLMIRGNAFYAIWDEEQQKWTTDEFEAIRLIDKYTLSETERKYGDACMPQLLVDADNCLIDKWKKYCQKQSINNYIPLDETLIFSNDEKKRENYSSKSLPYPLEPGDYSAWDKLISTLYTPSERHKIEWSIGAIVSGEIGRAHV